DSPTLFTLGCTSGVIAKCYRWGYRPWLDSLGYGDIATVHWGCTRLARADYCGNGVARTPDGPLGHVWGNLPSPGPIETHGTPPPELLFEAGWNTTGAVCLSHARWLNGGTLLAAHCPNKLIAPGLGVVGATVCDSVGDVVNLSPSARLFN